MTGKSAGKGEDAELCLVPDSGPLAGGAGRRPREQVIAVRPAVKADGRLLPSPVPGAQGACGCWATAEGRRERGGGGRETRAPSRTDEGPCSSSALPPSGLRPSCLRPGVTKAIGLSSPPDPPASPPPPPDTDTALQHSPASPGSPHPASPS